MAQELDLIPTASEVRQRLAETVREARLLRCLLRVAIKADQERAAGASKIVVIDRPTINRSSEVA